jgi:hypothetical protein
MPMCYEVGGVGVIITPALPVDVWGRAGGAWFDVDPGSPGTFRSVPPRGGDVALRVDDLSYAEDADVCDTKDAGVPQKV